jgi:transcription elongation factor Elf1
MIDMTKKIIAEKQVIKVVKKYLCPVCCERRMVVTETGGKYYFVCENCGTKRGPLPDRRHLNPPEA